MADRIALVDDDQNILTSVALALESEGFDVDSYSDSEAALAGITRRKVDLAVLDIKMPRMDGIELLQKLRKQSQLPVIFLTSKDDELDEALGEEVAEVEARHDSPSRQIATLVVSLCVTSSSYFLPLKNKMAVNNIVKRGKVFFIFIMILF